MRKLRATSITLLLVAAPLLAGCGDDEKEGTAATRAGATTPAPAPKSKIPAELAGTWTATVKGTVITEPPDPVSKKNLAFTIKFLETGGVDNGPVMFLESDEFGEQAKTVTVSGDQITLDTDCQFAYAVKAEQLTWTAIGDDCPHDALSAALTAGPWQKTTG